MNLLCKVVSLLATSIVASARTISIEPTLATARITPHESYSSSVGVIGCKVNTNRIAYWPSPVDCNDICVRVSHEGRSLNLLKVDTSSGAFDISYDAWNYLGYGVSAIDVPMTGGELSMEYQFVPAHECTELIDGGSLPLLAANSMNYLAACLAQPDSFVAQNYRLYNILDPVCHWGTDELCTLDLAVSNQPACPGGLGSNAPLNIPVRNVQYGTGELIVA